VAFDRHQFFKNRATKACLLNYSFNPMFDSNLDITLFRGWSDKGRYVWSPFVTKLELRLRLSNISYRTAAGSVRTAPTGKIPYVEICQRDEPKEPSIKIGDSALIAKWFEEQGLIDSLNAKLDARDIGLDLAVRALIEDRLYFFNVCLQN
jgi:hypothetical protein